MRTTIAFVRFRDVQQAGEEGALMMRLAIAVNNFMSSDYFFSEARKLMAHNSTKDFGRSLSLFLIAVQIGYLHEAMLQVYNPNHSGPELTLETALILRKYIQALSPASQQDYRTIRALIDDPVERSKFERYVEKFRNRVAFHYDTGYRQRRPRESPVTTQAVKWLAKRDAIGKWNRPHRNGGTKEKDIRRFEFADVVMDAAVCREVWGIDDAVTGADLRDEADEIMSWIYDHVKAFVGFASELCAAYFADKSC